MVSADYYYITEIEIYSFSCDTFQVCETLYKEYDAVEDHPECETVEKTECDTSRYERGHCTL